MSNNDDNQNLRRSKRKSITPQEAEAERRRQREEEQARLERMRAQTSAIAEERRQAILNRAPTTSADRSDLDDIAYNLHSAYDWDGRETQCVTAVVRLNDGTYRVFPQRFMNAMQTYANNHYARLRLEFEPGGGSHLHAEMYAVFYYLARGIVPSQVIAEIGVSMEICPNCQYVLTYLGIVYNARWVTTRSSPHWINPWDILPRECKPPVKDWRRDDPDSDQGGQGGKGGLGLGNTVSDMITV